ncbi:hypothetical protein BDZ90DRAFT_233707 [Jaminaea rosea]|uniref:Uncharacterized protein n=1 Tax=Jaminaea rosea TaxID=1569628 RepID=A0A316UKA0_9BASI|nr:hypothetical protein BDZ90DRAFT_233707 [Jaminaea rosea]PWN25696.1 hypothetical protein BDZ90DRAFT_233707 [Jaminaea rosea]
MADAGPSSSSSSQQASLAPALDVFDSALAETTRSHLEEHAHAQSSTLSSDQVEALLTSTLIPRAQALRDNIYGLLGEDEMLRSTFKEMAAAQLRLMFCSLTLDEPSIIHSHLDHTISLTLANLLDDSLPLLLLEELNDRTPLSGLPALFAYLSSRVSHLTRNLSPSRGKGLVLLRLLNDMLRRLSKPNRSHLVLAGRILALLAEVFPLGERSGVNLKGEFNVGNVTRVDEDEVQRWEKARGRDEEKEEEEEQRETDPASQAARDTNFYRDFWGLQGVFSNPAVLFEPAPEAEHETEMEAKEDERAATTSDGRRDEEEGTSDGRDPQSTSSEGQDGASTPNPHPTAAAGQMGKPSRSTSPTRRAPLPPFQTFRNTTARVLDVFAEASAREREMSQAERAAAKGGRGVKMATATASATALPADDATLDMSPGSVKKRKREEMLRNSIAGSLLGEEAVASSSTPATTNHTNTETEPDDTTFPKHLTSPPLFEYQLRSPSFRSHILIQYLILLQYLLTTYTSSSKRKREEGGAMKNQQLQLQLQLQVGGAGAGEGEGWEMSEEEEHWARDTWRSVVTLLEETGGTVVAAQSEGSGGGGGAGNEGGASSSTAVQPLNPAAAAAAGRAFKSSILQSLRREARWVQWKGENCPAIDRPPLSLGSLLSTSPSQSQSQVRLALTQGPTTRTNPRGPPTFSLGTAALSQLWEEGLEPIPSVPQVVKRKREDEEGVEVEVEERLDGLEQLEIPPGVGDARSYAARIKREDQLAIMKAKQMAARGGAGEEERARVKEEEEVALKERKTSLNWRALRLARGETLRLWGKIGGGDVNLLLEAEAAEEGEMQRRKEANSAPEPVVAAATVATVVAKEGESPRGQARREGQHDADADAEDQGEAEAEVEADADATFMTAAEPAREDDDDEDDDGERESVATTAAEEQEGEAQAEAEADETPRGDRDRDREGDTTVDLSTTIPADSSERAVEVEVDVPVEGEGTVETREGDGEGEGADDNKARADEEQQHQEVDAGRVDADADADDHADADTAMSGPSAQPEGEAGKEEEEEDVEMTSS